jgi:hypothetical protein
MTEAERLRAQAERCTRLAQDVKDHGTADALMGLAAKSIEQASELERLAEQRRQQALL